MALFKSQNKGLEKNKEVFAIVGKIREAFDAQKDGYAKLMKIYEDEKDFKHIDSIIEDKKKFFIDMADGLDAQIQSEIQNYKKELEKICKKENWALSQENCDVVKEINNGIEKLANISAEVMEFKANILGISNKNNKNSGDNPFGDDQPGGPQ